MSTQPTGRLKNIATWSLVVLFHFSVTLLLTWGLFGIIPVWGHGEDILCYDWVFGWDWHIITHDPLRLFNANIFYPAPSSLATSDHMLGLLALWAIPWLITKKQLFSGGFTLFMSYVLNGIALHAWIRHWTKDHVSSGIAAAWVNLNPFRIWHMSAVHMVSTFWLPFALIGMDNFMVRGSKKWWLIMVAMFWLQFQTSYYHAFGALIVMGGYFILANWLRPLKSRLRAWVGIIAGCAVLFVSLAPFVLPYIKGMPQAEEGLKALSLYSPGLPGDLFQTYPKNILWGKILGMASNRVDNQPTLWIGFGIPLLGVAGIAAWVRKGKSSAEFKSMIIFSSLSALLFLLLPGPFLKTGSGLTSIPLPLYFLTKIFPPFANLRVPGRLLFILLIIWAPLVGKGLSWAMDGLVGCFKSKKVYRALPALLFFFIMLVDTANEFVDRYPLRVMEEPREITKLLGQMRVEGGIIEMPFTNRQYKNNALYMLQSLHHFIPMANGYGSFFPASFHEIDRLAGNLPDEKALEELAALGIRTYLLHLDMTDFFRVVKTGERPDAEMVLLYYPQMQDFMGVDEETARRFAASPHLTQTAGLQSDLVYVYNKTVNVTDRLVGKVEYVVPDESGSLNVYIDFIGLNGLYWVNPDFPGEVEFSIMLYPAGNVAQKAGPWKSKKRMPITVSPREPLRKELKMDGITAPGSYIMEITAGDGRIKVIPVDVNFVQQGM